MDPRHLRQALVAAVGAESLVRFQRGAPNLVAWFAASVHSERQTLNLVLSHPRVRPIERVAPDGMLLPSRQGVQRKAEPGAERAHRGVRE